MSDWPGSLLVQEQAVGLISSVGLGSPCGDVSLCLGLLANFGAAWPSANMALYFPMLVEQPVTVPGMAWMNGGTVSGNVDVGVYDYLGNRLCHTGSTAQAGTSTIQTASVSSTVLTPDLYYLAMAMDNATGQTFRCSTTAQLLEASGAAQQATAFPLPVTATFAVMAQSYMPAMAAQIASVL